MDKLIGDFIAMDSPFSTSLINVPDGMIPSSFDSAPPLEPQMTEGQKAVVDKMTKESYEKSVSEAFSHIANAVNQLNKVVGGFVSDDIGISFNPVSGQSNWKVKPKISEEGTGGADVGTAEKEYMVYQRKADDNGDPVYGFDYVRSVAATEE